jgi:hypothetical protein
MFTRRIATSLYIVGFVVIIVACDFEGGRIHGSGLISFANWNLAQILITLGISFIIGSVVSRRKI